MSSKGQMSQADAARIQSSEAKSGNDPGFAARAQSAGDRNAASANVGGQGSGGGAGAGASEGAQGASGGGQSGQSK